MRRALVAFLAAPLLMAQGPTEGPWLSVVVRDGDSLIASVRAGPITALELRLARYDAPEVGPKAKCKAEREAGDRATEALRDLTRNRVRVVSRLEFEAYGRMIAEAWTRDGRNVSDAMLAARDEQGRPLVRPLADGEKRLPWCPEQ